MTFKKFLLVASLGIKKKGFAESDFVKLGSSDQFFHYELNIVTSLSQRHNVTMFYF